MSERIAVLAHRGPSEFRALIVEPEEVQKDTPVILYLHGRAEASEHENELQKVCAHGSPPDQARQGRLKNVIVVAPQAPQDPEKRPPWDWESYLKEIKEFLRSSFNGHRILATGFSRGGLGVLQFIRQFPECVSKWAIVDPQPHPDGATGTGLSVQQLAAGWVRYGTAHSSIKNFGDEFCPNISGDAAYCPDYCKKEDHAKLARTAYHEVDALGGKQSLYAWLDLRFVP